MANKELRQRGDKILDTHLGSQSSRIAALKANLPFIGFELDEDYFRQGNERFIDYAKQLSLF
jgi:site-specific DNA-methyltransferase (adenine-specific)